METENKFLYLDNKLNLIEKKIDKITEILENSVDLNCKKMSQHINFIENIYQHVRFPLFYICSFVNHLISADDTVINFLEN